jgi:hypothetical protein
MEAIEFLKEYNRMCVECRDCSGCPLKGTECSIGSELSEEEMISIVGKTEQWSKEHSLVTNAQKFKEVFGFMPADHTTLFHLNKDDFGIMAIKWDEPYKEPAHED